MESYGTWQHKIEYNSQLTKVCVILNCVMGYGANGKQQMVNDEYVCIETCCANLINVYPMELAPRHNTERKFMH